jgi:1-acyl-sn-glycerol-3-phosphate acyltransferase
LGISARVAEFLVSPDLMQRARETNFEDEGHGFDRFGLHPDGVAVGLAVTRWLYENWFRVSSHGIENLPREGAVVLAANHSGMIPLDAFMVWADIVRQGPPGRVPRVVTDHFVPALPVFNLLFSRAGAIGGSRGNFHELLSRDEMVLVYPEGVAGVGKDFRDRYELQDWRPGHAELAIQHQAAIVPMAVIGAEEQLPQLAKLPIRAFGTPYLPVPATPFPLPVHYHLWYGEPIDVARRFDSEQCRDPEVVRELAAEVKAAVAGLIEKGLAQRKGVFR